MRVAISLFVGIGLLALAQPSAAWGPTGHELVGQIADENLKSHAKQQVAKILGYSLSTAATWLDCAKSVSEAGHYSINPLYQKPCDPFMPNATNSTVNNLPEVKRMDDFVLRNWDNCQGRPGKGCHEEYHFADVDPLNKEYGDFYGTSEHDIVHAINAALVVLQDKPSPAPFSIRDKKEALFLLAHLVGDLHQPLHVGAIYLSPKGKPVHPDKPGMTDAQKKASETAGGNNIELGSSSLHSIWDGLPTSWTDAVRKQVIAKSKTVAKTPGQLEDLAALWASETVRESANAFVGLKIAAKPEHEKDWPATKTDDDYHKNISNLAEEQVAKGGARLAQLLNTIWP